MHQRQWMECLADRENEPGVGLHRRFQRHVQNYQRSHGPGLHVYRGPNVLSHLRGTINPFVHALLGGFHLNASLAGYGSGNLNGFTMLMGGGADIKVCRNFAVRASGSNSSKNVRVSTGLVLRF